VATRASARRFRVARGYRRLLVPLDASPESLQAFEIACRLAADRRASVIALTVIEVPPSLPLDAHMADDEEEARRLLERAGATGDAYGVRVVQTLVRARDAGTAIVEAASSGRVELIVIGARRTQLDVSPKRIAPDAILRVLHAARSRVLVIAASEAEAA
jgi:nucleotide-binding universal stress UspA family protein